MNQFDHIFLNLFLKTIFKLKNKKLFLKTSFKKHKQTILYFPSSFNNLVSLKTYYIIIFIKIIFFNLF